MMKALKFAYDLKHSGGLPFIVMIEGELKGFCFLVDSGSSDCVVFKGCVEEHPDKFTPLEGNGAIWGVGGVEYETSNVKANVTFCMHENVVNFHVVDDAPSDKLFQATGIRMHGIIGTNFMFAYNMLIDFVKQRVIVVTPEP